MRAHVEGETSVYRQFKNTSAFRSDCSATVAIALTLFDRLRHLGGLSMRYSIRRCTLLLAIAAFGLCSSSYAVVLDDHFDDGDFATNTTGTGTGFIPYVQASGSVTES